MADIYQDFGNDLIIDTDGDLLSADGEDLTQQRIIRRLLTNPNTYIWHPDYGAGIPAFIGQPLSTTNFDLIKSRMISQTLAEDAVAKNPAPIIEIRAVDIYTIFSQINYFDAVSKQPFTLSFNVSR